MNGRRLAVKGLRVCFILFLGTAVAIASPNSEHVAGKRVRDVIEEFRSDGFRIAYSTSMLTPEMTVIREPAATTPQGIINEILRPYALGLEQAGDLYLVRKLPQSPRTNPEQTEKALDSRRPAVEELVVSASRYEILRNALDRGVFIDQRQIQQLPILGDDPIRAVQKIPGSAASGVSARSHIRGGETADTGIILNGNRLLEPFHVRNFQSIFSAIDSRAVDGIEVYTGSIPVRYGNQMGGMVVIDTIKPEESHRTELGLSVFNTSILSAGTTANSRLGWVASARRGNLDVILDEEFGRPSYSDFFGQLEANLSDASHVSINALVANNDIRLVTERNPLEPEESNSHSHSMQFWLNWQHTWSDSLSAITTVSTNTFNDHRTESVDDPEEIIAAIDDFREVRINRLEQHWVWRSNPAHEFRFGAEYAILDSDFDYRGDAAYFGPFLLFEHQVPAISRSARNEISGRTLAVYAADQWKLSERTATQFGVRWDHETYTHVDARLQLSPRLGIVHAVSPDTEIRANIGRYYQAQKIYDIQVTDGIDKFFPAQRTDSAVAGIQHRFSNGYAIRGEAYLKRTDRLHPRFENILNQLSVLSELKPDRVSIAADKVTSQGFELSIEQKREDNFSWWASYVLSSVVDRLDGEDVPRSWDQRHAMQLGATWTRNRWEFGMVATVHSGWPKTTLSLDNSDPESPVLRFTERNAQRYGYFATMDVRLRYSMPVRIGSLSYFFEISNLTNRVNRCCVDFDIDETAGDRLSLDLEEKNWLPLLPALGILWEF